MYVSLMNRRERILDKFVFRVLLSFHSPDENITLMRNPKHFKNGNEEIHFPD